MRESARPSASTGSRRTRSDAPGARRPCGDDGIAAGLRTTRMPSISRAGTAQNAWLRYSSNDFAIRPGAARGQWRLRLPRPGTGQPCRRLIKQPVNSRRHPRIVIQRTIKLPCATCISRAEACRRRRDRSRSGCGPRRPVAAIGGPRHTDNRHGGCPDTRGTSTAIHRGGMCRRGGLRPRIQLVLFCPADVHRPPASFRMAGPRPRVRVRRHTTGARPFVLSMQPTRGSPPHIGGSIVPGCPHSLDS